MDLIAHNLRTAATDLRRKIYASMPWGFRVAEMLVKLASDDASFFGNTVYAEFLRLGVKGMPLIRGEDPSVVLAKYLDDKKLADRLPDNYGHDFGVRVFRNLMRQVNSYDGMAKDEVANEVMSRFIIRILQVGKRGGDVMGNIDPGLGLRSAENAILKGVLREDLNLKVEKNRELSRTVSESAGRPDEEGGATMQHRDDRAWQDLETALPQWQMPRVHSQLKRVHPDAPLYVELLSQEYTEKEIIGDPREGIESMLPTLQVRPMTVQNWNLTYKPKIRGILRKVMRPGAPALV